MLRNGFAAAWLDVSGKAKNRSAIDKLNKIDYETRKKQTTTV
jgi:hypothetical protein